MLWLIRFLFVLSYLDLNWLPLFILKLTTCILILDLGKIRLAPGLKKSLHWCGTVHVRQLLNPTYYICIYYIL